MDLSCKLTLTPSKIIRVNNGILDNWLVRRTEKNDLPFENKCTGSTNMTYSDQGQKCKIKIIISYLQFIVTPFSMLTGRVPFYQWRINKYFITGQWLTEEAEWCIEQLWFDVPCCNWWTIYFTIDKNSPLAVVSQSYELDHAGTM